MSVIDLEILEDGTISVTTGEIAETQHLSADALLTELEDMVGEIVSKEENPNNPGKLFFKDKKVLRGGKIVKAGSH